MIEPSRFQVLEEVEHNETKLTIEQRAVIEKILAHLGLPTELPTPAPARSPAWLPAWSD